MVKKTDSLDCTFRCPKLNAALHLLHPMSRNPEHEDTTQETCHIRGLHNKCLQKLLKLRRLLKNQRARATAASGTKLAVRASKSSTCFHCLSHSPFASLGILQLVKASNTTCRLFFFFSSKVTTRLELKGGCCIYVPQRSVPSVRSRWLPLAASL